MLDTLHEMIGGRELVSAAIQVFYDRVLQDETLRHFFAASDMARVRAGQVMFVSMLLGGKVVYTGKDLSSAHAGARGQGLTDVHFTAFLAHFRAALEDVEVDPDKAEKIMELLEAKRATVLHNGKAHVAG